MALLSSAEFHPTSSRAEAAHPMRSVLVTVFSLKIAIAAVLLACVSLAPPVSAESPYQISSN
ncbi:MULTISPECIES: hypothetical protein [unclassified Rhizobium]|jgi:hypothetical protein|uniref:hypothetical protein n=1 Tax=unclassified Rhizobium TaxID=2613769 RepID=UPI003D2827D2